MLKRTWNKRQITPLMKGKQTKTARALKIWKIKVWALVIVSLYTSLVLIKLWDTAVGKEMVIGEVAMAKEELPMKDWVLNEVKNAGLNEYEAYVIINCESRWNPDNTYNNGDYGIDRGLWQINSKYHPEVSNSCSYDYKCATKEALRIYKERGNWSAWVCSNKL